jgi:hypothetical protein
MSDQPICPCAGFIHPTVIFNPPGRDNISYRIGDYTTFRKALLLARTDNDGNSVETELINWRANGKGDLAVQSIEWWAYLADILTFYNDRIANNSYLRTADLPENIQRLIRILGYRPRPGIGATGVVAALTTDSNSFTLPQKFQIQSKPSPGKQPQIFELSKDTIVGDKTLLTPDVVAIEPVANPTLIFNGGVLLKGTVTSVKVGDRLLVLEKNWTGTNKNYAAVIVKEIKPEKSPQGKVNTRVIFANPPTNLTNPADTYRLLKSIQFATLWPYPATNVISSTIAELNTIIRQIQVGDPVLFEVNGETKDLVKVTGYAEQVWYANPKDKDPLIKPDPPTIPIPIPHTQITFINPSTNQVQSKRTARDRQVMQFNLDRVSAIQAVASASAINIQSQVIIWFAWQDVGEILPTPRNSFDGITKTLNLLQSLDIPSSTNRSILLEDVNDRGLLTTANLNPIDRTLQLIDLPILQIELKSPLKLLLNLLPVSRGESVNDEILGSGNASIAGQEFVLQKSPLTYLLSDESTSGENYKSTLIIRVNDIEWKEVPSFYGQPPTARIFVTREDEEQKTHILFGDGINGARLPSGIDNIVASYRFGSGKAAPDTGTLNVIVKPYPNLKSIRNPVTVGGGADPDPPEQIRRYAPRSILTFGRAVSGDDYETISAQTPGVARAKAYWNWDVAEQRTLVLVYVGDDLSAVENTKIALKNSADPNRPILVKLATKLPIQIDLSVQIDPIYKTSTVIDLVRSVLIDPELGLFGIDIIPIGKSIYTSEIYAACLSIQGVIAVHNLNFYRQINGRFELNNVYRHDPGEGNFYHLQSAHLNITPEV